MEVVGIVSSTSFLKRGISIYAPWIVHVHAHTCMFAGTARKLKIAFVSLSLSLCRFSTHEQNLAGGDEKETEEDIQTSETKPLGSLGST